MTTKLADVAYTTTIATVALFLAAVSAKAGPITDFTQAHCPTNGKQIIFQTAKYVHSTTCGTALNIARLLDDGYTSNAASHLIFTQYTEKPTKLERQTQNHNPNIAGTLGHYKKWNWMYDSGKALTVAFNGHIGNHP